LKPAKRDISWVSTTIVLIIGLMVNDLFPAKMGELARAYLIGEREKLPKTLCLSTIMVEHLLDILILSLFLILFLPLVSVPLWLRSSGLLVGLAALGIIVLLVLIMRREEKSLKAVFVFTYIIMIALGLSLPFYAAIMVVIFAAFAKIIPSSPGAVGTYHYVVIVVLTAFGISKEAALSLAIVLHGCGLVVEVAVGVLLLFRCNISLSKITRPEAAS
ncbi:MAG: lysylphosphatidylglycerol synthase transmembrane domain-containing protein, partial [Deltaproteobacteria bacterium]|nr:lysylphosphatidylglycerol synthase transmembrane domain-containing protein [Deltaproteobacteria bacterium]